jgi:hypothetical protein
MRNDASTKHRVLDKTPKVSLSRELVNNWKLLLLSLGIIWKTWTPKAPRTTDALDLIKIFICGLIMDFVYCIS